MELISIHLMEKQLRSDTEREEGGSLLTNNNNKIMYQKSNVLANFDLITT